MRRKLAEVRGRRRKLSGDKNRIGSTEITMLAKNRLRNLYYIILRYIILRYITLRYIILYYIVLLYYIVILDYSALYYMVKLVKR